MSSDHGLHAPAVGLKKYFRMGQTVAPGDSHDALQASYVESLELLDMATIGDKGFTAVKKYGDADGLIDDFGVEVEIPVLEDPASEFSEGSRGLFDPVFNFGVQGNYLLLHFSTAVWNTR